MEQITEPQVKYLTTLLDTRVVPESTEKMLRGALAAGALGKRDASKYIDALRILAWKPRTQAATPSPWAQAQAALADVDTSFYAIPAGYVVSQRIDLRGNDYLFIRVRNYQGKRYMSRVHGNVGGFSYSRMDAHTVSVLAALIVGRALEFQRNFHAVTGKCGRCAADLTDKRSRELGFGPDCAKVIGL